MKSLICVLLATLLAANLHAATWERRSGSYTPTNHSVNTTKWQTISANREGIPSAKIDGEFNHVYQALNDIEARANPSLSGNSGKFLTNDGTETVWGLISSTAISSGATASGLVLQANGSGGAGWGTISASALPASGVTSGTYGIATIQVNEAGQVVSATSNTNVSLTALTVSGSAFVRQISATNISTTALALGEYPIVSNTTLKARVFFNGNPAAIIEGFNVSSVTRTAQSEYGVSFTNPRPNSNYQPICNASGNGNTFWVTGLLGSISQTTTGFRIKVCAFTGGTFTCGVDADRIECIVP